MSATTPHPLMVVRKSDHPIGCLQGYCWTTFTELVARLGQPHIERGDKTTVEWHYECQDGTCFHVYDWKEHATPAAPYLWHIGGTSRRALDAFSRHTGLPSQLHTIRIDQLAPERTHFRNPLVPPVTGQQLEAAGASSTDLYWSPTFAEWAFCGHTCERFNYGRTVPLSTGHILAALGLTPLMRDPDEGPVPRSEA